MSPFGAPMRDRFLLEPDMVFLNHGSFGATPIPVLQAERAWREQMERQPLRFFLRELPPALREAATRLAGFVGADPGRLAFVENASSGVNAVLRSLDLRPGDRVVFLSHVYGAVYNTLRYVAARTGAHLVEVRLPAPVWGPDEVLERLHDALRGPARLVVLDHITSTTGLLLPIEELVQLCRDRDVPVLVDGAHALGAVPLDLEALGADWYVSNAHKWLLAPKTCALLHVAEAHAGTLHPTTISHGYGGGVAAEFDFIGTRDYSPWLAVTAALDFIEALGVDAMRSHNRQLALDARALLRDRVGFTPAGPESMVSTMASLRLPERFGPPTAEGARNLHDHLWDTHRIEVMVQPLAGALWMRVSGQIYNEIADLDRLVDALEG